MTVTIIFKSPKLFTPRYQSRYPFPNDYISYQKALYQIYGLLGIKVPVGSQFRTLAGEQIVVIGTDFEGMIDKEVKPKNNSQVLEIWEVNLEKGQYNYTKDIRSAPKELKQGHYIIGSENRVIIPKFTYIYVPVRGITYLTEDLECLSSHEDLDMESFIVKDCTKKGIFISKGSAVVFKTDANIQRPENDGKLITLEYDHPIELNNILIQQEHGGPIIISPNSEVKAREIGISDLTLELEKGTFLDSFDEGKFELIDNMKVICALRTTIIAYNTIAETNGMTGRVHEYHIVV
jgi:hypothetical protein